MEEVLSDLISEMERIAVSDRAHSGARVGQLRLLEVQMRVQAEQMRVQAELVRQLAEAEEKHWEEKQRSEERLEELRLVMVRRGKKSG